MKALDGLSGGTDADKQADAEDKKRAAADAHAEDVKRFNAMANLLERHERISYRVRNKK